MKNRQNINISEISRDLREKPVPEKGCINVEILKSLSLLHSFSFLFNCLIRKSMKRLFTLTVFAKAVGLMRIAFCIHDQKT